MATLIPFFTGYEHIDVFLIVHSDFILYLYLTILNVQDFNQKCTFTNIIHVHINHRAYINSAVIVSSTSLVQNCTLYIGCKIYRDDKCTGIYTLEYMTVQCTVHGGWVKMYNVQ